MCYHVLNRGNRRAEVFHHDGDYAAFIRLIRQACARVPMRVLGYCLMPNHFHVVLWPPGRPPSRETPSEDQPGLFT
jgi:putative transposase